jgi:hypothetical protein
VDAKRVLTAEDFALIQKLKQAQAERMLDPRYRTKAYTSAHNPLATATGEYGGNTAVHDFTISAESLKAGMSTGKTSKIERIRKVLEGRKENGIKWQHEGHAGGLTNKEKLRNKNFVMVRKGKRSVANKIRKSNSDQRYEKMKHVRNFFYLYF